MRFPTLRLLAKLEPVPLAMYAFLVIVPRIILPDDLQFPFKMGYFGLQEQQILGVQCAEPPENRDIRPRGHECGKFWVAAH